MSVKGFFPKVGETDFFPKREESVKIVLDFWGYINYTVFVGYKKEVYTMSTTKKIGRPFAKNPKSNPIHVRLDDETQEILDKYCKQEDIARTEGIRRGIKKLRSEIKE